MKKSKEIDSITNLRQMLAFCTKNYDLQAAFKLQKSEESFEVSYYEFEEDVKSLGSSMIELGIRNSKVAILSENRYEWCVAFLAVICGIGTAVPIRTDLDHEVIHQILNKTACEVVFVSSKYSNILSKIAQNLPELKYVIELDERKSGKSTYGNSTCLSINNLLSKGFNIVSSGYIKFSEIEINPIQPAVIFHKFANDGKIRGVMLSHQNMFTSIKNVSKILKSSNENVLSTIQLSSTYSCIFSFLTCFFNGYSISFCSEFSIPPFNYAKTAIRFFKPTVLVSSEELVTSLYSNIISFVNSSRIEKNIFRVLVQLTKYLSRIVSINFRPTFLKRYLNIAGGNLKIIYIDSSLSEPAIINFFEDIGIKLVTSYVLDEASGVVCINPPTEIIHETCGLPVEHISLKTTSMGKDRVGKIVIKGESIMTGYFMDDDATKKVLVNDWLYTEDFGRFEKKGYLNVRKV